MPSSMPSAMPLLRGSGDASFTATLLPHKIQYATRKAINAKPRCALMRLRENSAKNTLNRLPSSTLLKPRALGSGLQSKAQRGRCTPTFRDALRAEKEVAGSRISSGCTFQAFQWRESLPSFSQLPFFFANFCAFKLLDLSYFCYLNF